MTCFYRRNASISFVDHAVITRGRYPQHDFSEGIVDKGSGAENKQQEKPTTG
jgi:hypothetical protein